MFQEEGDASWLDQTFSIKYLIFYYREMGFEIKLQVAVFDADYKNTIFEKILYIGAAWLALKIFKNNCH